MNYTRKCVIAEYPEFHNPNATKLVFGPQMNVEEGGHEDFHHVIDI